MRVTLSEEHQHYGQFRVFVDCQIKTRKNLPAQRFHQVCNDVQMQKNDNNSYQLSRKHTWVHEEKVALVQAINIENQEAR